MGSNPLNSTGPQHELLTSNVNIQTWHLPPSELARLTDRANQACIFHLVPLCLSVSRRGWNNRRETAEGICQHSPWLGSINVPLACFSTQTLETNSLPTQGSCLDKHWWIPVAEAANRVLIPPFFLAFCSLPLFHFSVLVSQLLNQFSFLKELRSYSSQHWPLAHREQNKSQAAQ